MSRIITSAPTNQSHRYLTKIVNSELIDLPLPALSSGQNPQMAPHIWLKAEDLTLSYKGLSGPSPRKKSPFLHPATSHIRVHHCYSNTKLATSCFPQGFST